MKLVNWILALLPYALALALATYALPHMPAQLPTHWGPSGEPDAWGSAAQALYQMPMLLLPGSLLVLSIGQFSRQDRDNAPIFFLVALGLGLLALIETAHLVFSWDSVKTSLVSLGGLFALIGNGMGKLKPSAFAGLRTPWVYLSRRAWHASQRRTGLWLTVYGLLLALPALVLPREYLVPVFYPGLMTVGGLGLVGGLAYASYLDYRKDPDPQPTNLGPRPQA
ncbi:protein of unknown function DUF1648 [Deinococcus proteolyticus MRP]|uniref:DUF1648 domain-containing protein n=1 Tax=Deinococcus proteolyticus (strain ATCC 35074 / DSM 20540 / JCM 6276 / NBRC 101906 / NCIMB 13154 / VKM Ac-1939 / CCM 2703 / MRP) TaxID=693977 RepID=F0RN36_DEIPM|nr:MULTISPECIES: DUF1648 domain-containing protein [Deinococcus]ADY26178.1 protein of unknown function DUF1648 [Deinococcus proteolyticus MRP]MCY1702299.1 DUF1648 domain-containing protein [Deinococcus sp. SL84]